MLAYVAGKERDEIFAVSLLRFLPASRDQRVQPRLLAGQPAYFDAYLLLAEIYEQQGKREDAEKVYNRALTVERVPEAFRNHIRTKLEEFKN